MAFEYDWKVRFTDADPFGIAHYPRIFEAIHDVSDRFMDEIGYPFWEILEEEEGYALPIVELNAEFEQPLPAGTVVTISLTPSLGEKSVRFDYEARLADGSLAFRAYEQRVCATAGGGKARRIPDGMRAAMAEYADE